MTLRKSLVYSFAERYMSIVLSLASFVILARLLTPEDIGIYSVAIALLSIAHIIRDFGIGAYLVQEKELTHERIQSAFTITLITAISLFFIIQAIAVPVSKFYNDNRMVGILRLISITFLIIPFNATTISILTREMNFSALFWIRLSGNRCATRLGELSQHGPS